MRKYLLAAAATVALASPATARDGSFYVGLDAGAMIVEDTDLDYEYNIQGNSYDYDEAAHVDYNTGYDVGLLAGYDFGMFRVEGEFAYKRAGINNIQLDPNSPLGIPTVYDAFDTDGHVRVWSAMVNGLVDFGDEDGWSGFIGGGIGYGNVKYDVEFDDSVLDDISVDDSDGGIAWQIIAGVRRAITPNLDLGLKYRLFTVDDLQFDDGDDGEFDGQFRSHSLLLSLIYNFAAPPPPPPPPPATQTCPDGTVILATDACPPPPPPPPPPPEPERG